jgi:hypothetical protein
MILKCARTFMKLYTGGIIYFIKHEITEIIDNFINTSKGAGSSTV